MGSQASPEPPSFPDEIVASSDEVLPRFPHASTAPIGAHSASDSIGDVSALYRESSQELRRRVDELQTLYRMSDALGQAVALPDIYDEAIDGLLQSVKADRASVLVFGPDGVMRFTAWRGLSDAYRDAVEGHSPWTRDSADAQPITVRDVEADPSMASLRAVLGAEGIRSLAFIPLLDETGVLGKFMMYFDTPHEWTESELRLSRTIARHVSFAILRHRRDSELREANRAKSLFLATMSHELRTPLNAIAGYTDLLDAGLHGDLTDAQREAVSRIQVNQRHLLRLIEDVLDFAKLEGGHLQFEISNIPVQETLDIARMLIEPQLRAKSLQFDFQAGEPDVTCRADRAKVQQVLANLLSNASKFTPGGGRVTLEWEATQDQVHVHVRDTGPGIPSENLEDVFAPFVQLNAGFRRKVEGTGLGLAISRELARGMNGDVTARSTPGGGSTFTLTLARH
jgi:signal transduction histidine kinase